MFFLYLLLPGIASADTEVGGMITRDTVWTAAGSPYIVKSNLTVQGTDGNDGITTLTIDPGVEVRINRYVKLSVGAASGSPGALIARGTAENRITFTSAAAPKNAGDWNGIYFYNTADDASSALEFCDVEYGGNSSGAIYIYNASPMVRHSAVRYSKTNGIHVQTGAPSIHGNIFAGNLKYALYYGSGECGSLTGNTLTNGFYIPGGTLSDVSGNTFHYNNDYPIRIKPDMVGKVFTGNTFDGLTEESRLEVTGGTVTADASWKNAIPCHITGNITVQGTDGADGITTLTIEPGARLLFNRYTTMTIGANSGAPGALTAKGTPAERIGFTSALDQKTPGDWTGIKFNNTADDDLSILEYCDVEYGGSSSGAIYIYNASPMVRRSAIHYSKTYGIYVQTGTPSIHENIFAGNLKYDLYYGSGECGSLTGNTLTNGFYIPGGTLSEISGNIFHYNNNYPIRVKPDMVGRVFTGNTFDGMTDESRLEVTGGTVTADASWKSVIPCHITGNITVQGTDGADGVTTLTIEPGARLLFNRYTTMTIGANSGAPGALTAKGTPGERIGFTSALDLKSPGDWTGIKFNNTADDHLSILEYCDVEYGGSSSGSIYIYSASPVIRHSFIGGSKTQGIYIIAGAPEISFNRMENNGTWGIYCASAVCAPEITGNSFVGNGSPTVRIPADMKMKNNTFSGETGNSIEVLGGSISTDTLWPDQGVPYNVSGKITVQGTDGDDNVTTLTIDPGVEARFAKNTALVVGATSGRPGGLIARGTSEKRILFTSNAAPANPGDWTGIRFNNTADDASSILEYCDVRYAGSSYGAIYIYNSSPSVQKCSVRYNRESGIYIMALGSNDTIIACNEITGNRRGITTSSVQPLIIRNSITGNSDYGIYNASGASVNAENNWWGSSGGPSGSDVYGIVSAVPFSTDPELTCSSALVEPVSPFPADGNVRMYSEHVTLRWEGSSQAVHDVYMGQSPENLQPLAVGLKTRSYDLAILETGESYFWKIISRDFLGYSAESPVWGFTTMGDPPDLRVAAITAVPGGNVPVGEKITFTAVITNSEEGPVVDPFHIMCRMNGVETGLFPVNSVVPKGGSVPVSWEWTVQEGDWHLDINADSEGTVGETDETNNTLEMNLTDVVDYLPPMVTATLPVSESLNRNVEKIEITLMDNLSAIDKTAVASSIRIENAFGGPVSGNITETADTYTFIPEGGSLPDGTYTVSLTASDIHANAKTYYFLFSVDGTPPLPPLITGGSVDSGLIGVRPAENRSRKTQIRLTGTRGEASSIWINGLEKAPDGTGAWFTDLILSQGMNSLEIWAKDKVLNSSLSVWVDVSVDAEQIINFEYNAAGRIKSVVLGNAR